MHILIYILLPTQVLRQEPF